MVPWLDKTDNTVRVQPDIIILKRNVLNVENMTSIRLYLESNEKKDKSTGKKNLGKKV